MTASDFSVKAGEIIEAGRTLHLLGLVPATSGNFSARLNNGKIAITVSGSHKGRLSESDIMTIDKDGHPLDAKKPSAETGLHVQIYRHFPDVGAILHPHAMNAVLLSRKHHKKVVSLKDYELLKAFSDIDTHETSVDIPVFDNDQNIDRLSSVIEQQMAAHQISVAYIIAGHGFYTWGKTMNDALRHVEALDYLLACELQAT